MKKYTIILIFIFALFLRVYKLGQFPVGFLWDEAALGYNAYSILETGRDEYGKLFPVIFKSFGDYKPGLYVYLTVPSIAIFGINEFAVRLPSAVAGSLAVILLYFLLTEARFTRIGERIYADSVPLVSALLLAVSPWHINFSRGAWELNVMLTELLFGFFLLMRFLKTQKSHYLCLGTFFFLLTLLTYQSAKLFMPAILFGFIIFFYQEIRKVSAKYKRLFLVIMLGGFVLFNALTFFSGKAGRLKVMSIFSYPRSTEETEMIQNQDKGNPLYFAIFHSSPVFFMRSVLGRYFNHFSGKFLFFSGDWSNPRNGTVYQGEMYLVDAFFIILGLAAIFKNKSDSLNNLMFFWLLIAPLSSALTRDSISAVRSFPMVIPLVYISASGVNLLVEFLKKRKRVVRYFLYCLLLMTYGFLFIRFLDLYFIHDPRFFSQDHLYGYKEMINYVNSISVGKDRVVITNKYGQPYIFYLFYLKYNPKIYQTQARLKESPVGDVGEIEKIDNFEFKKIHWPDERGSENSLFVGNEFELPLNDVVGQNNISLLKEIKFLNGKTAFRIVETK